VALERRLWISGDAELLGEVVTGGGGVATGGVVDVEALF
jgi:hypothetical protein